MKENVVIYTTPWCNTCHSLMDWLTKIEVSYEEKNIEDEAVKAEMLEKLKDGFPGTPLTIIGEEAIQGFDRPAILAALDKYGLKKK